MVYTKPLSFLLLSIFFVFSINCAALKRHETPINRSITDRPRENQSSLLTLEPIAPALYKNPDGELALRSVFKKIHTTYNLLAQTYGFTLLPNSYTHSYAQATFENLNDHDHQPLSTLRKWIPYYKEKIIDLQKETAKYDNIETEAIILGLKKALFFISNTHYAEKNPENPPLNTQTALIYFNSNLLKSIPELIKNEARKLMIAYLVDLKKTILVSDLIAYVQQLQLPKELYLKAYTGTIASITEDPNKKSLFSLFKYKDQDNSTDRNSLSPEEAESFVKHQNNFIKSLKLLTKKSTNLDEITTRGALFLWDEKDDDILLLPAIPDEAGSQGFKAAHSMGMAKLMGPEASKLSEAKKEALTTKAKLETNITIILDKIKQLCGPGCSIPQFESSMISVIRERVKEVYNNNFFLKEELAPLREKLQEYYTEYAAITAFIERTEIDREIQAIAHQQMALNGDCSDTTKGWLRTAVYATTMTKNEKTPREVLIESMINQAHKSYERKKALYEQRTLLIKKHAEVIAATITKNLEKTVHSRAPLIFNNGYPITSAKIDPIEIESTSHKNLLQAWESQRPSLKKEIIRLLPADIALEWLIEQENTLSDYEVTEALEKEE